MLVRFFDTESTDLTAAWGRLLCASYVDLGEGSVVKTFRTDLKPWKSSDPLDDSSVAIAIKEALETSDLVVGYNSILHDVPLLNARLAKANIEPIRLGEKSGTWHLDAMYYVGGTTFKIGGRSLDKASKFFGLAEQKTILNADTWQRAALGDRKAMNYVCEHCEQDVLVLKELFPWIAPTIKKFQFPLGQVYKLLLNIPSHRNRS